MFEPSLNWPFNKLWTCQKSFGRCVTLSTKHGLADPCNRLTSTLSRERVREIEHESCMSGCSSEHHMSKYVPRSKGS